MNCSPCRPPPQRRCMRSPGRHPRPERSGSRQSSAGRWPAGTRHRACTSRSPSRRPQDDRFPAGRSPGRRSSAAWPQGCWVEPDCCGQSDELLPSISAITSQTLTGTSASTTPVWVLAPLVPALSQSLDVFAARPTLTEQMLPPCAPARTGPVPARGRRRGLSRLASPSAGGRRHVQQADGIVLRRDRDVGVRQAAGLVHPDRRRGTAAAGVGGRCRRRASRRWIGAFGVGDRRRLPRRVCPRRYRSPGPAASCCRVSSFDSDGDVESSDGPPATAAAGVPTAAGSRRGAGRRLGRPPAGLPAAAAAAFCTACTVVCRSVDDDAALAGVAPSTVPRARTNPHVSAPMEVRLFRLMSCSFSAWGHAPARTAAPSLKYPAKREISRDPCGGAQEL